MLHAVCGTAVQWHDRDPVMQSLLRFAADYMIQCHRLRRLDCVHENTTQSPAAAELHGSVDDVLAAKGARSPGYLTGKRLAGGEGGRAAAAAMLVPSFADRSNEKVRSSAANTFFSAGRRQVEGGGRGHSDGRMSSGKCCASAGDGSLGNTAGSSSRASRKPWMSTAKASYWRCSSRRATTDAIPTVTNGRFIQQQQQQLYPDSFKK